MTHLNLIFAAMLFFGICAFAKQQPGQVKVEGGNIQGKVAGDWSNFAGYGDPNGKGVPDWPAFSDANPEVMYLGPTPHTVPVPSAESHEVLDNYFRWRLTTEGKNWVK